ncbi:MAG: nicotinate-nicotinamide nucleotide adenylyltransferase, partial [Oscillibacter sp.]|nr:nicotinate-nicotinamide nucleotide adenylyltransferase [Oscillibacter sp.]
MKIGIYGGTFNPPHLGHLAAARAVFELLRLDELWLVPAGMPPHKDLPAGSPTPEQRLEMTRLAGEQLDLGDRVKTLDIELRREGKSYTADTLAELTRGREEDTFWLLMGTDMFLTFHTWHEPERILSLAGIAAFGRTEEDAEELFSLQRERLYRTFPQARIFTLTIPGVVEVS